MAKSLSLSDGTAGATEDGSGGGKDVSFLGALDKEAGAGVDAVVDALVVVAVVVVVSFGAPNENGEADAAAGALDPKLNDVGGLLVETSPSFFSLDPNEKLSASSFLGSFAIPNDNFGLSSFVVSEIEGGAPKLNLGAAVVSSFFVVSADPNANLAGSSFFDSVVVAEPNENFMGSSFFISEVLADPNENGEVEVAGAVAVPDPNENAGVVAEEGVLEGVDEPNENAGFGLAGSSDLLAESVVVDGGGFEGALPKEKVVDVVAAGVAKENAAKGFAAGAAGACL